MQFDTQPRSFHTWEALGIIYTYIFPVLWCDRTQCQIYQEDTKTPDVTAFPGMPNRTIIDPQVTLLQKEWSKNGISRGIQLRIGIALEWGSKHRKESQQDIIITEALVEGYSTYLRRSIGPRAPLFIYIVPISSANEIKIIQEHSILLLTILGANTVQYILTLAVFVYEDIVLCMIILHNWNCLSDIIFACK